LGRGHRPLHPCQFPHDGHLRVPPGVRHRETAPRPGLDGLLDRTARPLFPAHAGVDLGMLLLALRPDAVRAAVDSRQDRDADDDGRLPGPMGLDPAERHDRAVAAAAAPGVVGPGGRHAGAPPLAPPDRRRPRGPPRLLRRDPRGDRRRGPGHPLQRRVRHARNEHHPDRRRSGVRHALLVQLRRDWPARGGRRHR